jgi:hypothetical protein
MLWRDVTYVPDSEPGSAIRLRFKVKGNVQVQGRVTRSSVSVNWGTVVRNWFAGPGGNTGQAVVQLSGAGFDEEGGNDEITDIIGWDTIVPGPLGFVGTMHIDVPYDSAYGGYSWLLSLNTSAYTFLQSGSAQAASLRSVGLTAITDLEDNPIVGATFDSGLAAVPEPSCGLLLSLILFGRVGFSRSMVRKAM